MPQHPGFRTDVVHSAIAAAREPQALDADEFATRVRGFRLELLQIDRGRFNVYGTQIRLGQTLLSEVNLGRAAVHWWSSPPGSVTIAMKTSDVRALWRGIPLELSDIMIVGPRTEIEIVSQAGFKFAAATFERAAFERAARFCGLDIGFDHAGIRLLRLEESANDRIRAALRATIAEARTVPFVRKSWAEHLLELVTTAVSASRPSSPASTSRRVQALDGAIAAIRKSPAEIRRVADLCRMAGARERTLRKAFVERYTLPTAQFLKALRLNGARWEIGRPAGNGARISEIANRWGFWHLGQFAHDYRRWFDELPSGTYERRSAK
jgi:AraC family ethanolamine operon transcriptional activator